MTAQSPDRLVNEHPEVDLGGLLLYHVSADLPEAPKFNLNVRATNLWRGYIANYRLNSNGTLELLSFKIPTSDRRQTIQNVTNGLYFGDFEITLRPFFAGPNTTIPFIGGTIQVDRESWKIDNASILGWQIQKFKNSGFTINTDAGISFIPNSLIPDELMVRLQAGYDGSAECEIHRFDSKKNILILRLLKLV